MALKPKGALLLAGIIALAVLVGLLVLPGFAGYWPYQLVGLLALYGYLFVALTAVTNPFLKEFVQALGKPFLKIHHAFAVLGIVFITLHPIFYAIESSLSFSVFIPNFDNWTMFWTFAGKPAFYVFYIAVLAAVLRKNAVRHWKPFHTLMYVVLFFGIIHANLLGSNFQNVGIAAIYDALFAASMAGLILKRYQNYQTRKAINAKKNTQSLTSSKPAIN
jgi:predicted ferric reductase